MIDWIWSVNLVMWGALWLLSIDRLAGRKYPQPLWLMYFAFTTGWIVSLTMRIAFNYNLQGSKMESRSIKHQPMGGVDHNYKGTSFSQLKPKESAHWLIQDDARPDSNKFFSAEQRDLIMNRDGVSNEYSRMVTPVEAKPKRGKKANPFSRKSDESLAEFITRLQGMNKE